MVSTTVKAMISIAVTSHNRSAMTIKSFIKVLDDPRVKEVVIVDDCSQQKYYRELVLACIGKSKIRLVRNARNLGCYFNKRESVRQCSSDFVLMLDSDNVINRHYLDALPNLEADTIYAPEFARPHFDYRYFRGKTIHKSNVRSMFRSNFETMMNTCNYVVPREAYLKTFDDRGGREPWTADTLFFNYTWLKAGNKIHVVKGLQYDHLVHDGSHYRANMNKTGRLAQEISNKLKLLR